MTMIAKTMEKLPDFENYKQHYGEKLYDKTGMFGRTQAIERAPSWMILD